MKFTVGYQADDSLGETILRHRDSVVEIYFPWEGFTSGRGVVQDRFAQRKMEADLERFAQEGLAANLLLNGNCYGRYAQARSFFQSVGDTVAELIDRYKLGSVTTTSPLIAKFLKANFKDIEVRASVNMEIGTTEGFGYIAQWFDSYYLRREFNYDCDRLETAKKWCEQNGKKLYLLANSGCLNFCSAHNFHDNLVAHQHEIAEMDNAYDFRGVCHDFLANPQNRESLLRHTNFIRPEDVPLYETLCDGMKLATRTNRNPSAVVEAYCSGKYSANLLDLTEPSHAGHLYPSVIENGKIAADYAQRRLHCDKRCQTCGYCDTVQKNATVNLEQIGSVNFYADLDADRPTPADSCSC